MTRAFATTTTTRPKMKKHLKNKAPSPKPENDLAAEIAKLEAHFAANHAENVAFLARFYTENPVFKSNHPPATAAASRRIQSVCPPVETNETPAPARPV